MKVKENVLAIVLYLKLHSSAVYNDNGCDINVI